ncbi:MAG: hypothetical protein DLM53_10655 [Candidatus Eremiobacter antarcticus]|nr:hypothetical protein [Candidatus Eremiobacteraeota bacterium]PZR60810.1 MAG: hypothetical protein DLM53_10655 [Candidatus Eremiobacter sp. RRmetagenome_bin22]
MTRRRKKPQAVAPQERPPAGGWRTFIFKNRGLLLVPVAIALVAFGSPSVTSALAGILVALAGEALRIWAVGYSGTTTRADTVTAPLLATAGPYSKIRNPLYVGNAVIALGFWIAFSGRLSVGVSLLLLLWVAALVVGVYAAIIPLEESYLMDVFGAAYRRYRDNVPRLLPLKRPLPPRQQLGKWQGQVILKAEVITLAYFILMVGCVLARLAWPAAGWRL